MSRRGIQQKVDVKYVSDRGDEYIISEMEDTHLLNVIIHHRKQRDELIDIRNFINEGPTRGTIDLSNIAKRIISLDNTILMLFNELVKRDPDRPDTMDESYNRWRSLP